MPLLENDDRQQSTLSWEKPNRPAHIQNRWPRAYLSVLIVAPPKRRIIICEAGSSYLQRQNHPKRERPLTPDVPGPCNLVMDVSATMRCPAVRISCQGPVGTNREVVSGSDAQRAGASLENGVSKDTGGTKDSNTCWFAHQHAKGGATFQTRRVLFEGWGARLCPSWCLRTRPQPRKKHAVALA